MGSGSSRGGRALKRLRGPGGAASEGGTGPAAAAGEEAQEAAAGPPDARDETRRLLDQLLAESAAWGSEELAPPRPAARAPSPVPPKQSAKGQPESGGVSEAPGSSHTSAVRYDYSEEELMASIEQEYCR